ncbi:hypothetical protein B0J12DRAFT_746625 [Macrophomina phaseolina]|uniref:Uncharacterized protein n=1 Tax=Macrophomina phaseolina TaxID=35725 RepID=A0ABQ8FS63_9PEZI|nr:hypothetical protein B0J12DRAFT_746625 [Macrophomina phaseolina]
MYHHHQQPSYNPYAAPNPPQYGPQYGNWAEQARPHDPLSPNTFSGSFQRHASPQYQHQHQHQNPQYAQQQYQQYPPQNHAYNSHPPRPMPTCYPQRRTSVQQRWDDYVASDECSEALQGADRTYITQVSSELEQRAMADERLGALQQQTGVNTQHAQQAERERRLKWAQDMIIQNPALCAEVYFAMSKRSNNDNADTPSTQRSSSNSSANSSNSSSPT